MLILLSLELPDPGPHAPGKLALNLTLHHHIKPGQAIVSRSYLYYLVCRRKQCLALTLWLSPVSETCLPECVGKFFVSPRSAWANFLSPQVRGQTSLTMIEQREEEGLVAKHLL